MLTARKAKPKPAGLTISQATRDARKVVNVGSKMPGPFATVESRNSWDAGHDVQVIITMITFPANERGARLLADELLKLSGRIRMIVADSSIVITRKVY